MKSKALDLFKMGRNLYSNPPYQADAQKCCIIRDNKPVLLDKSPDSLYQCGPKPQALSLKQSLPDSVPKHPHIQMLSERHLHPRPQIIHTSFQEQ